MTQGALNWGTAIAALAAGAGLGLMERKRQDDMRNETEARQIMGKMLIENIHQGNDITPLLSSPKIKGMFDKDTLNTFGTMARSQAQMRQQQEQAVGLTGEPAIAAPTRMYGEPSTAAPAPASATPAPSAPQAAAPGMALAMMAGPAQVGAPAEAPPSTIVGPAAQASLALGAPKPPAPTPPSAAPADHGAQVNDLAGANYFKPGELKRIGEGVGVSMPKIGGGTISLRGPTEEEFGRRIFARAQQKGYSYAATVDAIVQKGAKIPDDLRAYGGQLADREYANQVQGITGGERSPTLPEARQAAYNTFLKVGYASDTLKPLLVPTRDDESRLWRSVVLTGLQDGRPLLQAMKMADATGAMPDVNDAKFIIEQNNAELQKHLQDKFPNASPEQIQGALIDMTGGFGMSEAQRAAAAKPAPMAPATEQRLFEETGRVPRLSDVGTKLDITGARTRAETRETEVAGIRAKEVKAKAQEVPEKPTTMQQGEAISLEASRQLGTTIEQKYAKLREKVGGAFGTQGRLAALKIRLNQAQESDVADLVADTKQLKATLLHALSGAQTGSKDPYLEVLPDVYRDSNVEFIANVRATIRNIERLQAVTQKIQEQSGVTPPSPAQKKPPLTNPFK